MSSSAGVPLVGKGFFYLAELEAPHKNYKRGDCVACGGIWLVSTVAAHYRACGASVKVVKVFRESGRRELIDA